MVFIQKLSNAFDKFKQGLLHVLGANVLNKVITMLSNMVVTRVLTSEEFGSWSYILNIYTYLLLISGFGLGSAAFQFGAENTGNDKEYSYYKYCMNKGLLINLGLVVFGILLIGFIKLPLKGLKLYLICYIPILIMEYVVNLLYVILRCKNRINEYAKYMNVNTILVVLGTCVGAIWGIWGIIIGRYVAFVVTVLLLIYNMKSEIKNILEGLTLTYFEKKELWGFSIMVCISAAMNSVLYLIDVSMVTSMLDSAEITGIYKVSTLVPHALSFIPASFVVVVLPTIISNSSSNVWLRNNIKRYYIYMATINGIVGCIFICAAQFIIKILSGEQYITAVTPFRILMIGYVISSTFRSFSANILIGLRKVNVNMIVNFTSAIADIILNVIFIPRYGMIGAAIATVSAETIASVISFCYTYNYIYKKKNADKDCKI